MPKPGDLLKRNGKFSFLEKVAYLTPVFYCGHEDIAAFGYFRRRFLCAGEAFFIQVLNFKEEKMKLKKITKFW